MALFFDGDMGGKLEASKSPNKKVQTRTPPVLSPSNLMETLNKSPGYFDGDRAHGIPP